MKYRDYVLIRELHARLDRQLLREEQQSQHLARLRQGSNGFEALLQASAAAAIDGAFASGAFGSDLASTGARATQRRGVPGDPKRRLVDLCFASSYGRVRPNVLELKGLARQSGPQAWRNAVQSDIEKLVDISLCCDVATAFVWLVGIDFSGREWEQLLRDVAPDLRCSMATLEVRGVGTVRTALITIYRADAHRRTRLREPRRRAGRRRGR